MLQTLQAVDATEYEERAIAETPFNEAPVYESQEEPLRETSISEARGGFSESWELQTPFISPEAMEAGEAGSAPSAEVASLAELASELKDSEFREALEQLADEALEMHADQLAGEYGDRESRDLAAERLLNEHFQPLAAQTEAMLDRFLGRVEGYETEALTEMEIERIVGEVLPTNQPMSPASEQFLGGLVRKVGKLVSSAAKTGLKLAGKGLALAGKLALGPLLGPLKKLARFLLGHVVKWALNKIPASLRPLAQKLSDRLFHALGETHEGEAEQYEQTETENVPTAPDIGRLEAEFDLHAAQLLLTPDETEADHLVTTYGESADQTDASPLRTLDRARAELTVGLSRLQPGESAQPVMEQFLPAIAAVWPAVKAGIAMVGRPKVVKFVGGLLANLIKPMLGADSANMLAPAIADVGLKLFGLEAGEVDSHALASEALAATIEETATSLGELPPHVFENETLLDAAVREAFEGAAATYFPSTLIKPELRETADGHGMWLRMPVGSEQKRYAKYSQTPAVTITPRTAATVQTFGGNTLQDHLRDRMDIPPGRTIKTNVRLYQATPGTRAATIARAEGIRPQDLHPLTPQAAGALLGGHAGLGSHPAPPAHLASPHKLHMRQRLYYIEPPNGRQHIHHRHHARLARTELVINLRKGEIRIWLYLTERLCQHISAELGKTRNATTAFRLVKPLVQRAAHMLKAVILERHMPPTLRVISETPNLDARVPAWLTAIAAQLGAKIDEWASLQVAQYLSKNAEEFRRISATHHDGATLRITMTQIPGIATLRLVAQGKQPQALNGAAWLKGTPDFAVVAHPGYAIK
jgi:hypothetical protein